MWGVFLVSVMSYSVLFQARIAADPLLEGQHVTVCQGVAERPLLGGQGLLLVERGVVRFQRSVGR